MMAILQKVPIFLLFTQLLCHYANSAFENFMNSGSNHQRDSPSCRQQLDSYHYCLQKALEKTRLNRTGVDIGVKKCFEENKCKVPNFEAIRAASTKNELKAANRRLQQTPFKNVDADTFEKCKAYVNNKARDRIRQCVANQIPQFAPDIDEDVDEDGEEDGQLVMNRTMGSYAISKLADREEICNNSNSRILVKECIDQVFEDNQPNKNNSAKIFDEYCEVRDECKERLAPSCANQLNQTHRQLCQCSINKIASSEGDDLRDEFFGCTKVDKEERGVISSTDDANPHRLYATEAFCKDDFDPCTWLWRELEDEESYEEIEEIKHETGTNNLEGHHPFYENKTEGQLGAVLSNAVNQEEIDRLNTALNTFINPKNEPKTDQPEHPISDLLKKLTNNTDGARFGRLGADFFGFERFNGSEIKQDLKSLTTRMVNPEVVEHVTEALNSFVNPKNESKSEISEQSISDLLKRLTNNTEGAHFGKISADFFGFQRFNGSEIKQDLKSLTTKMVKPEVVEHVTEALKSFTNPINDTKIDQSEQPIPDLLKRLMGNNTEGARFGRISADFFGFQHRNSSESHQDLKTLTTRMVNPEVVERVSKALNEFMHPGNETVTESTVEKSIGELVTDMESDSAAEAKSMLSAVNKFVNPSAKETIPETKEKLTANASEAGSASEISSLKD